METKWLNVIRDLAQLAIGSFGLIHSQLTGTATLPLVIVYAALLGVPGVLNLIELRKPSAQSKGQSSSSQDQPSSRQ